MEQPEAKIAITDNLVKLTRNFIKDVAGFREMMVGGCLLYCAWLGIVLFCLASLCLPTVVCLPAFSCVFSC
jgi:hypothetical protein